MRAIVDIQLRRVEKLLAERGFKLEVAGDARDFLVEAGYDPDYGARPLKRSIQRELQDPLALRLLNGDFRQGETILVTARRRGARFCPVERNVNLK